MDLSPELINASTSLATHVAKKSGTMIWDKIMINRQKGDDKALINILEEIVNELISEKNELIQLAQKFEESMVAQRISDEDIDYITEKLIPLLEIIMKENEGNAEAYQQSKQNLEMFKPLLSKETFNILQLLGFNFKQAIGTPLTELVNGLISSSTPVSKDKEIQYRMLTEQRQIEFFKLVQDEKAYERYMTLIQG